MTAPKPPTPQGISALLKRAGFPRAERQGRAGGHSSGFIVRTDFRRDGTVRVAHHFWSTGPHSPEQYREKLAPYAETIKSAGWTVEAGEYELTVTAGKAD